MPASTRFFLNALRSDKRALPTSDPGRWKDDSTSGDFLFKYASDIHIEGQVADPRVSHSVPSVYARPLQFAQALSDEKNPLHDAIVGEWRGLLAVFGLASWTGRVVRVTPYDVPTDRSPAAAGSSRDLNLRTMLREQLPRPNIDWSRFWLLYCDDCLIGATSPWTMAFTPAQYHCPPTLLWQKDGIFIDPIKFFDPRGRGRSQELAILLRWVELIQDNHDWNMPKNLEKQAGVLSAQLEAWRKDLSRYAREDIRIERLSPFPVIGDTPYDRFLIPPLGFGIGPGIQSDLLLESAKLKARPVLALSRTALSRSDRIFGATLVEQVDLEALPKPQGKAKWKTRTGQEIPVEYVFVEEAFLPPKIVELPLSTQALQRGSSGLALPLTPMFFEYFDHADLAAHADMLSIDEVGDAVIVRLRLPLAGRRTLTIEKSYDRSTDVVRLTGGASPAFGIWPDYYGEDWPENFAAYVGPLPGAGVSDFRVAPVLASGKVLDESRMDGSQKPTRIWRCQTPPIGFALTFRDHNSNMFPCGMLLRSRLNRPADVAENSTWEVAVDFGTSSTTIMCRKNGGEPMLLPLQGRTVFLAESPLAEIIDHNLYPSETALPPFPTLLYQSSASLIGGDAFGYTLRFVYSFEDKLSQPVPNVKWGTQGGRADTQPMKQYLRGLVRFISSEARNEGIATVTFKWSYPLSLPEGAHRAMSDYWSTVAATYSRPGSTQVQVTEAVSESDAICRCLAEIQTGVLSIRADSLTIAVDVGGGSTDVGFWTTKNLVDQFSFKLAGNDVLDRRWLELPNCLETVWAAARPGQVVSALDMVSAKKFSGIVWNVILSQVKDPVPNPRRHPVPMAIHGGMAAEPPWLYLRSIVYLFFTGIAYYIGLHARKWVPANKEITIYFGGRGSSLLTWLSADENKTAEVLREAFNVGLQRPDEKSDSQSDPRPGTPNLAAFRNKFVGPAIRYFGDLPALKHEVARGLLCSPLGGTLKSESKTIVGEVGWKLPGAAADILAWDTEVDKDSLSRLKPPSNHESGHAAQFLGKVIPKYLGELNLDQDRLRSLTVSSGAIQECIARAASSDQVLQPVFACELKTLMDQYIDLVFRG